MADKGAGDSGGAAVVHCTHADFVGSYPKVSLLPADGPTEIAIAGRSNVGKSSLLNTLLTRKALARTGATPGVTRMINLFTASLRFHGEDREIRVADLPGYGFAKVPRGEQERWGVELHSYLTGRRSLRLLLLLLDSRRDLTEDERYFFDDEIGAEKWLIFTKVDQLKRNEQEKLREKIAGSGLRPAKIFLTSSEKRTGVDALREEIFQVAGL